MHKVMVGYIQAMVAMRQAHREKQAQLLHQHRQNNYARLGKADHLLCLQCGKSWLIDNRPVCKCHHQLITMPAPSKLLVALGIPF